MTWRNQLNALHRRAMDHVDLAMQRARRSDASGSDIETRLALDLEEQAIA